MQHYSTSEKNQTKMIHTKIFGVFAVALWLWITMVDARFIGGRGVEKYVTFGQNYVVKWGQGHISTLHSGKEVDLYMDQSSG